MGGGTKFGLGLMFVGLAAAIALLLNKPSIGRFGSGGSAFEAGRITRFPPWKHAIPLIGKHWVVEFEGCDGATINSGKGMKQIVTDGARAVIHFASVLPPPTPS